jgi:TRAP-type mannitol/chloroaromatic compound transport system permease large subunit
MIPQMKQRGFDADFAVNVSRSPPPGGAAGAALAQPDPVFGGGRRRRFDRRSVRCRHRAGADADGRSDDHHTWFIARKRGYAVETFPGASLVLRRLIAALPGLLLIGIILGGIKAGVFTAVESAAIAVIYALTVALVVYRSAALARLPAPDHWCGAHHRRRSCS